MAKDAEQEAYEEELQRHNKMCELASRRGGLVDMPEKGPELDKDGSYKDAKRHNQ